MTNLHIANAPCSWGALEFEGLVGKAIAYPQMLDDLSTIGYAGTEFGDWGYFPTEPTTLRRELERRGLLLVGAFVPVAFKEPETHATGEAEALKIARLLAAVVPERGSGPRPHIILADANGTDPQRTRYAGRISSEQGLSAGEWRLFARGAERIARVVREETGLPAAFHHHCAGYVETPVEIARLLELTDPALLGLVFDTGHYLYGTGGVPGSEVIGGFERFAKRIWHVHFKDCQPEIATEARAAGWDYLTAIRRGLFCELGQGAVPFPALIERLQQRHYQGWIVVEQDVLPGMGHPRVSAEHNWSYIKSCLKPH